MGAESSKPISSPSSSTRDVVEFDEKLAYQFADLDIDDIKHVSSDLSIESISRYSKRFYQDSKNLLAKNALAGNDPTNVFLNSSAAIHNDRHTFNVKIDLEGSATNQKSSGRCWLFAGTNIMRIAVITKYNLPDDFELSQSYLFFYGKPTGVNLPHVIDALKTDKLEKANWFLENMIDLAHEDIDDRVVQYLLTDPVGDGGQFDMLINLVEKYGVVPKSVFPETFSSSNTRRLNWLVTVKLREFATVIRKQISLGMSIQSVRVLKEKMMEDIYRIITIHLGEPPSQFDWETQDKNGKYIGIHHLTPKRFFKEVVNFPVSCVLIVSYISLTLYIDLFYGLIDQ